MGAEEIFMGRVGLVPVSKIPPFTFRHLVISGVSSYS